MYVVLPTQLGRRLLSFNNQLKKFKSYFHGRTGIYIEGHVYEIDKKTVASRLF